MLDQLRPPTDNLYKFSAVSGIVILLVSLVLPGRDYLDLSEEIFLLEQDIQSLEEYNTRMSQWNAVADSIVSIKEAYSDSSGVWVGLLAVMQEELEDVISRIDVALEEGASTEQLDRLEREYLAMRQRHKVQQANLDSYQARADSFWLSNSGLPPGPSLDVEELLDGDLGRRAALLDFKTRQLSRLGWLWLFMGAVGVMLAQYGFRNWYVKYQEPADYLMRDAVREAQRRA